MITFGFPNIAIGITRAIMLYSNIFTISQKQLNQLFFFQKINTIQWHKKVSYK